MVVTAQSSDGTDVRILARGNFSLNAGGLINLLLALTVVTLGLAAVLAWLGYWPVLLIAVVQIVLVTWVLARAWEQAWVAEQIVIGPERIEITHQRHKRKRHCELETAWAAVELQQPQVAWYEPRVVVRSRGQRAELGQFLTLEERRLLAEYLRRAIAQHSAMQGVNRV
jgi:uncharacterized membrane protein